MVFFGSEHADELAAAVVELPQLAAILRVQRTHGGGDDLAEVGDDGGVNDVGFGESAQRFGEVAYLPRVDDDGGEPLGEQGPHGSLVIGPGGFKEDAFRRVRADPGTSSAMPAAVLAKRRRRSAGRT